MDHKLFICAPFCCLKLFFEPNYFRLNAFVISGVRGDRIPVSGVARGPHWSAFPEVLINIAWTYRPVSRALDEGVPVV
jgi:hypothetical protein